MYEYGTEYVRSLSGNSQRTLGDSGLVTSIAKYEESPPPDTGDFTQSVHVAVLSLQAPPKRMPPIRTRRPVARVPRRGVIAGAADARIEHLGRQIDIIEVAVIVVLQGLQVRQGVLGYECPPFLAQWDRWCRGSPGAPCPWPRDLLQLLSPGNSSFPSLKAWSIPSLAPANTIPRFLYVVLSVNVLYVKSLYILL